MSKKIKIFIIVFILTGIVILGVYFWLNRNKTTTGGETPWYQNFNPFGTGATVTTNPNQNGEVNNQDITSSGNITSTSRFHQITDFAVAGATFLEDIRPIEVIPGTEVPQTTQVILDANTKDGRKEIQSFLNESLSINPPLKIDGNFGKSTFKSISDFQKLNNLTVTGKVDEETAPHFTKTIISKTATPKDELVPSIRYVKRMNGHVYKMFLDNKNKEEISNTTIPSIYEALFNNSANTFIYRYLSQDNTISSFMATLATPKGDFLPQGISDLSISTDGTKYFYLIENSNGVTGTIGTFGGTNKDVVFNSPFTEWLSQWTNNQQIYLTTKASSGVDGSIFSLNTTTKTISKVFGGVEGLTTLVNPISSMILYSTSTNSGPKLGIFDINKHTTKDLSTYGLPEKCVWGNDNISIYCGVPGVITGNQYPDIWYQGLVSFDDYFVKINTLTGDKTTIVNSTNETPIDGIHLFLDDKENSLFFINKKDSTLWSLDLN